MPPKKPPTLTRPELSERSYDFSKPAEPEPSKQDEQEKPAGDKNRPSRGNIRTPQGPPYKGGPVGGPVYPQKNEEEEKKQDGSSSCSDPKEEIVLALLALSPADRRDVLARLSLSSKQSKTGKGRELDMWTEGVYSALVVAVGASGEVGSGPGALRRLLGDSSSWGPVSNLLRQMRTEELKVGEQQSVLNMLGSLLVDHAMTASRKSSVPLTPRFVASCASNLPAVYDASFPGYLGKPQLVAMMARALVSRRTA